MGTSLSVTSEQLNLPSDKFKIALCQLSVSSDKVRNIDHAHNAITSAAEQGAKLAILPDFHDERAAPSFSMLSEAARCNGITVVGGSVPELDNGRLFNTTCVFGPDGKLMAKHRKLHLFDIEAVGGDSSASFWESDSLSAGDSPTIVNTGKGWLYWHWNLSRYSIPRDSHAIQKAKGAQLICYPGAFNMSTGEMLWGLVQRARAVDNQQPARPPRDSACSYQIWGHSTLVGPFGEIIATSGYEEAVVIAEINTSEIQCRRASLPLEKQARKDIYRLIDFQETNC